MEPIVVVGAGLSGVTCARTLADAGLPVVLRERSRTPGGRMASRRVEGRRVDLGASYLTVSDDRFAAVVDRWQAAGLAHPWTDTFDVRDADGSWQAKPGPVRWGASQGLRSLVEHAAEGLEVRTGAVAEVDLAGGTLRVDGDEVPAVVLAMPDPQARRLLTPALDEVAARLDDPFEPILALTAVWDERRWDHDGVFVNGSETLSWIADDGRRRGDGASVLVAHSTPDFARPHLDDPAAAQQRARGRALHAARAAAAAARAGPPLDLRQALRGPRRHPPADRGRPGLLRRRVVALGQGGERLPVRPGARRSPRGAVRLSPRHEVAVLPVLRHSVVGRSGRPGRR